MIEVTAEKICFYLIKFDAEAREKNVNYFYVSLSQLLINQLRSPTRYLQLLSSPKWLESIFILGKRHKIMK